MYSLVVEGVKRRRRADGGRYIHTRPGSTGGRDSEEALLFLAENAVILRATVTVLSPTARVHFPLSDYRAGPSLPFIPIPRTPDSDAHDL